jgi:hydrogenase maturation protease
MTRPTLIIGLGSSHGDDQFGWTVVEQLQGLLREPNATIRLARSPAQLLDWLEGFARLIIFDACENLGTPGELHFWRWPALELVNVRSSGSHDLSLPAALALAQSLDLLPRDVLIVCAEGRCFSPQAPISSEVGAAASRAIELTLVELAPAGSVSL